MPVPSQVAIAAMRSAMIGVVMIPILSLSLAIADVIAAGARGARFHSLAVVRGG
jgi:hypothetical protein